MRREKGQATRPTQIAAPAAYSHYAMKYDADHASPILKRVGSTICQSSGVWSGLRCIRSATLDRTTAYQCTCGTTSITLNVTSSPVGSRTDSSMSPRGSRYVHGG